MEQTLNNNGSNVHKFSTDRKYLLSAEGHGEVYINCNSGLNGSYYSAADANCMTCTEGCSICSTDKICKVCVDDHSLNEDGTCTYTLWWVFLIVGIVVVIIAIVVGVLVYKKCFKKEGNIPEDSTNVIKT